MSESDQLKNLDNFVPNKTQPKTSKTHEPPFELNQYSKHNPDHLKTPVAQPKKQQRKSDHSRASDSSSSSINAFHISPSKYSNHNVHDSPKHRYMASSSDYPSYPSFPGYPPSPQQPYPYGTFSYPATYPSMPNYSPNLIYSYPLSPTSSPYPNMPHYVSPDYYGKYGNHSIHPTKPPPVYRNYPIHEVPYNVPPQPPQQSMDHPRAHTREILHSSVSSVFVGNIPFQMTKHQIAKHMSQAGKVNEVHLLCDWSGNSKGCAIVSFDSYASVQKAIVELDKSLLGNRHILVREDRRSQNSKYPSSQPFKKKKKQVSLSQDTIPLELPQMDNPKINDSLKVSEMKNTTSKESFHPQTKPNLQTKSHPNQNQNQNQNQNPNPTPVSTDDHTDSSAAATSSAATSSAATSSSSQNTVESFENIQQIPSLKPVVSRRKHSIASHSSSNNSSNELSDQRHVPGHSPHSFHTPNTHPSPRHSTPGGRHQYQKFSRDHPHDHHPPQAHPSQIYSYGGPPVVVYPPSSSYQNMYYGYSPPMANYPPPSPNPNFHQIRPHSHSPQSVHRVPPYQREHYPPQFQPMHQLQFQQQQHLQNQHQHQNHQHQNHSPKYRGSSPNHSHQNRIRHKSPYASDNQKRHIHPSSSSEINHSSEQSKYSSHSPESLIPQQFRSHSNISLHKHSDSNPSISNSKQTKSSPRQKVQYRANSMGIQPAESDTLVEGEQDEDRDRNTDSLTSDDENELPIVFNEPGKWIHPDAYQLRIGKSPFANTEGERRVFLGNLPKNLELETLKSMLEKYGKLVQVEILNFNQETNLGSGSAIALYFDKESAHRMIQSLNNSIMDGTEIYARIDKEAGKKVFIRNIPSNTSWSQLKKFFSASGTVIRAYVSPYKTQGSILFSDPKVALSCVKMFHNIPYQDYLLDLSLDEY